MSGSWLRAMLAVTLPLCVAVPAPAAEDDGRDRVLATVDGKQIRESDLKLSYSTFGDALKEMPAIGMGDPKLERFINFRLISEAARKAGLDEDQEVRRSIEQMADLVLYQTFLFHFLSESITESALRDRYEVKYEGGKGLRQVRARHIRLKDRAAAEAVIEALNRGADFEELAKERSIASSGPRGGDTGFVGPGDVSPAFLDMAFSLKPGELASKPVETSAGWEVIKVESRRSQKAPTYQTVKPSLKREAATDALTVLLDKLRGEAEIEPADRTGK